MSTENSIGHLKGRIKGPKVWHRRSDGKKYWSGKWHERTAHELMLEAFTVLADLKKNRPELRKKIDAKHAAALQQPPTP